MVNPKLTAIEEYIDKFSQDISNEPNISETGILFIEGSE